jgi:hypothetical protein
MTEDPAGEIARAAARRLVPEFGVRVEAGVEAALYAQEDGVRHEYDPVAIGALIVSIAQLAWTIYSDHRTKAPDAPPEHLELVLRNEIRREVELTPSSARITDVVVKEVIDRSRHP